MMGWIQRCFYSPRLLAKAIRCAYIVFGTSLVCYGLLKTIEKVTEGNILVKEGVRVLANIKYPSVTFCYKYKHGSKDAEDTYNLYFAEEWKKSGKRYNIFYSI